MIFWILLGIVIGYLFKPQLDVVVVKAVKFIKDVRNKSKDNQDE